VAAISLAAAIFHTFNHGLFKALLFLGAGTVDCRIHTRDLELMGGLGKKMPGDDAVLCYWQCSHLLSAAPQRLLQQMAYLSKFLPSWRTAPALSGWAAWQWLA
jgi:NADH:ubiquinone oxidoreductase subunit 5 (subunit L)/multisubunit Na+/H+ antiporter MnhA subunit